MSCACDIRGGWEMIDRAFVQGEDQRPALTSDLEKKSSWNGFRVGNTKDRLDYWTKHWGIVVSSVLLEDSAGRKESRLCLK